MGGVAIQTCLRRLLLLFSLSVRYGCCVFPPEKTVLNLSNNGNDFVYGSLADVDPKHILSVLAYGIYNPHGDHTEVQDCFRKHVMENERYCCADMPTVPFYLADQFDHHRDDFKQVNVFESSSLIERLVLEDVPKPRWTFDLAVVYGETYSCFYHRDTSVKLPLKDGSRSCPENREKLTNAAGHHFIYMKIDVQPLDELTEYVGELEEVMPVTLYGKINTDMTYGKLDLRLYKFEDYRMTRRLYPVLDSGIHVLQRVSELLAVDDYYYYYFRFVPPSVKTNRIFYSNGTCYGFQSDKVNSCGDLLLKHGAVAIGKKCAVKSRAPMEVTLTETIVVLGENGCHISVDTPGTYCVAVCDSTAYWIRSKPPFECAKFVSIGLLTSYNPQKCLSSTSTSVWRQTEAVGTAAGNSTAFSQDELIVPYIETREYVKPRPPNPLHLYLSNYIVPKWEKGAWNSNGKRVCEASYTDPWEKVKPLHFLDLTRFQVLTHSAVLRGFNIFSLSPSPRVRTDMNLFLEVLCSYSEFYTTVLDHNCYNLEIPLKGLKAALNSVQDLSIPSEEEYLGTHQRREKMVSLFHSFLLNNVSFNEQTEFAHVLTCMMDVLRSFTEDGINSEKVKDLENKAVQTTKILLSKKKAFTKFFLKTAFVLRALEGSNPQRDHCIVLAINQKLTDWEEKGHCAVNCAERRPFLVDTLFEMLATQLDKLEIKCNHFEVEKFRATPPSPDSYAHIDKLDSIQSFDVDPTILYTEKSVREFFREPFSTTINSAFTAFKDPGMIRSELENLHAVTAVENFKLQASSLEQFVRTISATLKLDAEFSKNAQPGRERCDLTDVTFEYDHVLLENEKPLFELAKAMYENASSNSHAFCSKRWEAFMREIMIVVGHFATPLIPAAIVSTIEFPSSYRQVWEILFDVLNSMAEQISRENGDNSTIVKDVMLASSKVQLTEITGKGSKIVIEFVCYIADKAVQKDTLLEMNDFHNGRHLEGVSISNNNYSPDPRRLTGVWGWRAPLVKQYNKITKLIFQQVFEKLKPHEATLPLRSIITHKLKVNTSIKLTTINSIPLASRYRIQQDNKILMDSSETRLAFEALNGYDTSYSDKIESVSMKTILTEIYGSRASTFASITPGLLIFSLFLITAIT